MDSLADYFMGVAAGGFITLLMCVIFNLEENDDVSE